MQIKGATSKFSIEEGNVMFLVLEILNHIVPYMIQSPIKFTRRLYEAKALEIETMSDCCKIESHSFSPSLRHSHAPRFEVRTTY